MKYQLADRMANMKPSIIREILKQMSDPGLISFAGGNPAAESFPVEDIVAYSDELLRTDPVGMLQYSVTEGVPETRDAVRKFINRKGIIAKETDALVMMTGSQQIMEFVAKSLCNEGDTIVVENPAFLGALNAFRSYGAELLGVSLQSDGVDLEQLEQLFSAKQKPKFFYCIPNFQNPTGRTMSLAKRKAVYALSVKYGVPVLEDNPYGALRFSGEDVPPIKSFDTENNVIYAASFSKILSPGMRLACCVCDETLMKTLVVAKQCCDVHTNVWAQRVCAAMLSKTDIDAHIKTVQGLYKEKAALMIQQLDALCPEITYIKPEGGMFIWGNLPAQVDTQTFIAACLKEKVALIPGSAFFVEESAPCQSFRMNFSTPSKEDIRKGIAIMASVLKQLM